MKLGIIGIGKIASALVEGWCTADKPVFDILLSPRNEKLSAGLAEKFSNVRVMESNQDVLDRSDVIIIALRPAAAVEVLKALSFQPRHTVVSLIPLLKYADLAALVRPAGAVCRAIPLPTVVQHNCPIPLFRAPEPVVRLFRLLGQPLAVEDEGQLHAIWTLTGLITPFYELLGELAGWTLTHGVSEEVANTYVADLFQSLAFTAQHTHPVNFTELASHAATPNGMNEQAGKEIRENGAHATWRAVADRLMERFQ